MSLYQMRAKEHENNKSYFRRLKRSRNATSVFEDSRCCSHERWTRLSLEQSDLRTYCSVTAPPGVTFSDSFTRGRGTDSSTRLTSVLTENVAPSSSHTRSLHWLVHPSPQTALHRLFPLLKCYESQAAHQRASHLLLKSRIRTKFAA